MARMKTEQEAKIQSDRIDEQIRLEERELQRKRRSEIKVGLLIFNELLWLDYIALDDYSGPGGESSSLVESDALDDADG